MTTTLVVGAGPVGLTAALELARRGIDVRIIERSAEPASQSRAIGINPRTLDILEASGATEQILAEGLRINRARLVSRGRTLGVIDFNRLKHRFPFMTALPQRRTQAILEECLAVHGVRVERGAKFERFVRRGGRLACQVSGGGASAIDVDRLLGCDGAHSDVRAAAGIAFDGRAYDHNWTLADVEVDWPFPPDEAVFMFGERGTLFAIPLVRGVYRLVRNGPEPQALVPAGARVARVIWASSFRISHRLAARFAANGVFLAGDAAHVHSPAGARGMNGGIEDAATFAWLAAGDQLHRYETLRRPAARRVLRQVDRQTRQADINGGPLLTLREAIARAVLPLGPIQRLAGRFIAALDQPPPPWLRGA
jgi:2-polyprenyl-6-methoxyphenol hydroxylase-like FAD-dependent oxidoreductase